MSGNSKASDQDLLRTIIQEIEVMAQEDRRIRTKGIYREDDWKKMDEIDMKNTARIKEIVQRIGWPRMSHVGESVCDDAWLLVQHADHDISFQKHCLTLMKELMVNFSEEICLWHVAYLEDRIMTSEVGMQLYGTQFRKNNGVYEPVPIQDPEGLNRRRNAIGMEPFVDKSEEFNEHARSHGDK